MRWVVLLLAACSATARVPDDASRATDGNHGDAGLLPFGSACATDAQCATHICFVGGARSFCTVRCPDDGGACPDPPSDGTCNTKGYCRAP